MTTNAASNAHPVVNWWWLVPVLMLAIAAIVLRTFFGLQAYRREKAGEKRSVTRGVVVGAWIWVVIMVAFAIYFLVFEHFNSTTGPTSGALWVVIAVGVATLILAILFTLRFRRQRRGT